MTQIMLDKDEDWEKRILCIDESCIGTIGHDGRCRECGKIYDAKIIPVAPVTEINQGQVETAEIFEKNAESSITDDDWEKRVLCSDETCIGTIGPGGRCRECGKPGK